MARVFEDIKLAWNDVEYVVKSDRVMIAIARIEDVITLLEIYDMLARPKAMKLSKIAAGYAAVLRYAGATVKDEDVYAGMFTSGTATTVVVSALAALLGMMVPTSAVKEAGSGSARPGKAKPAAPPLSRKRSRSPAPPSAPADGE